MNEKLYKGRVLPMVNYRSISLPKTILQFEIRITFVTPKLQKIKMSIDRHKNKNLKEHITLIGRSSLLSESKENIYF